MGPSSQGGANPPPVPDLDFGLGGQSNPVVSQPPAYQPQPVQPQAPVYQPQVQNVSATGKKQTGIEYYSDVQHIAKFVRGCSQNCAGMNAGSAIEAAQNAIKILSTYIHNPKPVIPYSGGTGQANFTQKQKDFNDAKHECKKALSEIDFGNLGGCLNNLNNVQDLLRKY